VGYFAYKKNQMSTDRESGRGNKRAGEKTYFKTDIMVWTEPYVHEVPVPAYKKFLTRKSSTGTCISANYLD
jgi:hypothetical protein